MEALDPLPALAGRDLQVPLATGGTRRYVNLGRAAYTTAMKAVVRAATRREHCAPLIAGGGAVDFVTLDLVLGTRLPERLEAVRPTSAGSAAAPSASP